jgi:hypothetical protein
VATSVVLGTLSAFRLHKRVVWNRGKLFNQFLVFSRRSIVHITKHHFCSRRKLSHKYKLDEFVTLPSGGFLSRKSSEQT